MSLSTIEQYDNMKMILSGPNDTLFTPEQKQQALDDATAYIQSMCYQVLELTDYEEQFNPGNLYCSISPEGWLNIFPRRQPIVEVATVSYRLLPSADLTEIDADLLAINLTEGKITIPYSSPIPRGRWAEVVVEYSAGYEEVPGDLVEANTLVAAHFLSGGYAAVDNQGNNARSVVPNWAWGNGSGTKSIVDDIIDRYQRRF